MIRIIAASWIILVLTSPFISHVLKTLSSSSWIADWGLKLFFRDKWEELHWERLLRRYSLKEIGSFLTRAGFSERYINEKEVIYVKDNQSVRFVTVSKI